MEDYEGWAIVELMGHRKLAGRVMEQEVAGVKMLRLDVPSVPIVREDGGVGAEKFAATQFYSAAALYCLTPTTETLARAFAARAQPAPVSLWELPPAMRAPSTHDEIDDTVTQEAEEDGENDLETD